MIRYIVRFNFTVTGHPFFLKKKEYLVINSTGTDQKRLPGHNQSVCIFQPNKYFVKHAC